MASAQRRLKTGGRQKGTPNKVSGAAREVIAQAAECLGGTRRLVAWARRNAENETLFWTRIYPRLVPHEVVGAGGVPLLPTIVTHVIEQ